MSLNSNLKAFTYSTLAGLGLASVVSAASGVANVGSAVGCLCSNLVAILPVVSMLMIIGAGVVYAAGQIMGAETRARANTWATAMLVGAIIGILIVTVAPSILSTMYGSTGSIQLGTNAGGFVCDAANAGAC